VSGVDREGGQDEASARVDVERDRRGAVLVRQLQQLRNDTVAVVSSSIPGRGIGDARGVVTTNPARTSIAPGVTAAAGAAR
jgi:hypothetical protein